MRFIDLLRLAKPLTKIQKNALSEFSISLDTEDIKEIKGLLKQRKVSVTESSLNISRCLFETENFYTFVPNTTDEKIKKYIEKLNKHIYEDCKKRFMKKFSKSAKEKIPKYIGRDIEGFDIIKKAVTLQLFATERIHILLLGDPGTGKTDILRSASEIHPISSLGLGSGTTGAGLTITTKGKEITKGLLPMADGGICAIDELNLMEQKERGSLYNAMEKGFVTYDKGGKHYKFDARVRVLATANPKGDKFTAKDVEGLKKQLPFDPALLSRFHLVFLIRKPN
ncbi:MAG: ATP-binding protein, partial [Nanoarchaeota archaeon]